MHGDDEWDGFEAGDQVEGALFGDGFEALCGGGADAEDAFWFFYGDCLVIGVIDWFVGLGDDWEDELEWGLGAGFGGGADLDG